jgi:hypothetical protein
MLYTQFCEFILCDQGLAGRQASSCEKAPQAARSKPLAGERQFESVLLRG